MKKQRIFLQEIFYSLAHEAIEDLGKTGLSYEDACQILGNFLGSRFAERFNNRLRSSGQ